MIGSHVAWVFIALLLGVGVGWLSYKRGRARLIDALIWIIIGLVVAAPILIPNMPAATTPLGTLVALFYFVGCPLGWTWRHGALVDHRCAETDARGYMFRGAPPPARWQSLDQQRAVTRAATAGSVGASEAPPARALAVTAHAVPSDGKATPSKITAITGANAGVATAPAPLIAAPADTEAASRSKPSPDKAPAAPSPASAAPAPSDHADTPIVAGATAHTADPVVLFQKTPTPLHPTKAATPEGPTASGLPPSLHQGEMPSGSPSAFGQTAQTTSNLSPASPADGISKNVEPAVAPSPSAAADPPASAPVPDQDKHAGLRPPGFVRAREDKPDDLQLIRGIGPQNEGRLHGLGIWHFDQIAAWTAEEVRWVGSYLAFPGRIDREKWVEQAREIAAGAIIPKAASRRPPRTT